MSTVAVRLFADDPRSLVRFIVDVFDAEGAYCEGRPSMLRVGDSDLMVAGTQARAATNTVLYVYVADADRTYHRAIAAGATCVEEPSDTPWGDRRAIVSDRFGTTWQIAAKQI